MSYEEDGTFRNEPVGTGATLEWAPSDTISFASCGVDREVRLILAVSDPEGASGSDAIVLRVQRIC